MTSPLLTADLFARAVIAAAQAYGDDPIAALTAEARPNNRQRRCLLAAASGLARATGLGLKDVSAPLGVGYDALRTRRVAAGKAGDAARYARLFNRAERSVEYAIKYALLRPEHKPAGIVPVVAVDTAPIVPAPPPPTPAVSPPAPRPEPIVSAPIFRPTREPSGMPAPKPGAAMPTIRSWVENGGGLGERIIDRLSRKALSAPTLATLCDAKESAIDGALWVLEQEGRVVAGEIPMEGRRFRLWMLGDGGAA